MDDVLYFFVFVDDVLYVFFYRCFAFCVFVSDVFYSFVFVDAVLELFVFVDASQLQNSGYCCFAKDTLEASQCCITIIGFHLRKSFPACHQ